MTDNPRAVIRLILVSSLLLARPFLVWADGGAVRLRERAGGYQIAVFTSPTPLRAGPVDVSVLVQDAETGECVPEARVTVRLTAREGGRIANPSHAVLEYPATEEAATNKLFRAAVFQLPEPGWWDVEVAVEGPHGPAQVRFGLQADEPLPRWQELWPWFSLPALAIALFCMYRVLARRKVLSASTSAGPTCRRSGAAAPS
jgi:hypothetical protein